MIGPWSELYLYNPDTAYHSDRLHPPRPFLDQVKSTLDRYEELERPKTTGSDFDAQWYRPFSTPGGLINDLIASLLILLAIYGSMLFHSGLADQPVASMAKAAEPEGRGFRDLGVRGPLPGRHLVALADRQGGRPVRRAGDDGDVLRKAPGVDRGGADDRC